MPRFRRVGKVPLSDKSGVASGNLVVKLLDVDIKLWDDKNYLLVGKIKRTRGRATPEVRYQRVGSSDGQGF